MTASARIYVAEVQAIFDQVQNAVCGRDACAALEALAESVGGLIAQTARDRRHADQLLRAVTNDLRAALDAHWADPRRRPRMISSQGTHRMTDIMVDLETLGTKPGCVILSLGAVAFDPLTGQVGSTFYRNIERASCEGAGLTVDPSTEKWWKDQSEAARMALMVDAISLHQAVADFTHWWMVLAGWGKGQFWAHSPSFDETILSAAFRAVGTPTPWKYSASRCTRTVYALAGVEPDRNVGTHHNALDDATAQAEAVHRAYVALGIKAAA